MQCDQAAAKLSRQLHDLGWAAFETAYSVLAFAVARQCLVTQKHSPRACCCCCCAATPPGEGSSTTHVKEGGQIMIAVLPAPHHPQEQVHLRRLYTHLPQYRLQLLRQAVPLPQQQLPLMVTTASAFLSWQRQQQPCCCGIELVCCCTSQRRDGTRHRTQAFMCCCADGGAGVTGLPREAKRSDRGARVR